MKPDGELAEEDAPVRLPGIKVMTERGAVAEFQRQTGAEPIAGLVPATFPFCWLTLPAVRPTIAQMIGDGFLPIHEAQSFDYERGLDLDAEYVFTVELRRTTHPPRLILHGTIATLGGEIRGRLETVLRIAPIVRETAP